MNKPVYEIPISGPEGAGFGSAAFPPPRSPIDPSPIELAPTQGEYPPPGSFAPPGSFQPAAPGAFPPPQSEAPPASTFLPPAAAYPPPAPAYTPPPQAPAYAPPAPSAYEAPAPSYSAPGYSAPSNSTPSNSTPSYPTPAEPPQFVDPSYDDEAAKAARAAADPDLLIALQEVVMLGASDLHVTSNAPPMVRIDGGLRPIEGSVPWNRDRVAKSLMSILNPQQIETFNDELELDIAYTISANARFRVNIYQQRGNIGGAFRLIPTGIKQLKDLGMPESIGRFATLPRGLVLVTGPTGSGKSTTLAAIIDLVNRTRADHIVTVEDPIEFLHTNQKSLVNQREVGADTHSFAAALKHVLRQDPDVILIGELRDLETISVALTAAETGHLVFATLHTQDAPQTIDRIIDVFPPHQQGQVRTQLAATLQGVVCQTLLRRARGSGRVVATEVMVTTPAIGNLIREGKTYQMTSAMQAGRDLGMHTMDQHLADLVNAGTVTHEAALEKVHDPEGFKRLVYRSEDSGAGSTMSATAGIDFGDAYSGK